MKIKLEAPPSLRGKEQEQIFQLHSYLFRLSEMLSIAFDSEDEAGLSVAESPLSPKAIFNSLKRLLCTSKELFDSVFAELLPRFQQLFLSITDFRQFSTNVDEKLAETEQKRLDTENTLSAKIGEVEEKIPHLTDTVSKYVESGSWQGRVWESGRAELWAVIDMSQTQHSLPISFSQATVIPAGSVSQNVLTIPTASGSSAVLIIGKEN